MFVTSITFFLTMFFICSDTVFLSFATCNKSSTVAFNLDQSQILSYGKELIHVMQQKGIYYVNQNIENAGVAFVKGANERSEFFQKINKQ